MRPFNLAVMLMLMSLLLPSLLSAQDETPMLTMQEAVSKTMEMNPSLNSLKATLEAKNLEWKTALGISTPEFGFAREGISAIDPAPFQEQRFTFQQEVDFPLTTFYRLKKQWLEKEALAKTFEALRKEVIAGVKSRYVEVIYANSIRELRQTAFNLSKKMLDAVTERLDRGTCTYSDKLSAEIGLLNAENAQYEGERDFHVARYTLFTYIGLDPDDQRYDIRFADSLSTHRELIEQELALYQLQKQPGYQSALLQRDASQYSLREAKSSYLPSFRFGYLVQDFGSGYHFRGFETGFRIPLWGMFEKSGKVGIAQANLKQRLWEQKSVELSINEKIEIAWHSYYSSSVSMDLFTNKLRDKSQELLDLTTADYQQGRIDRLKFLEAQQVYLDNRENYLGAQHTYYLRLVELEQYMDFELIH
ncbi:MAG: TolC family protein [Bacteroidia bacterium]|nr:TolC family protein [Bacteroidia bacterium]